MRHSIDEQAVLLRTLAGELQAGRSPGAQWLGRVLLTWLQHGGDLPALLGVRPGRGSTRTAQASIRRDAINRGLVDLARAVGGDGQASRMLQGLEPVPNAMTDAVQRLRSLGAPTSARAIRRARQRTRHRS